MTPCKYHTLKAGSELQIVWYRERYLRIWFIYVCNYEFYCIRRAITFLFTNTVTKVINFQFSFIDFVKYIQFRFILIFNSITYIHSLIQSRYLIMTEKSFDFLNQIIIVQYIFNESLKIKH